MSAGYDGSIRIDTSIDDKNFNTGVTKISSSMKSAFSGVLNILGKVGIAVVGVVVAVAAIAAAFIGAAIAVALFGIKLINTMSQAVNRTNAYGQQIAQIEKLFADVKGAAYAAFSPLITAALPYIQMVVSWLVKMLNTISMVIAALTGQKTVQQYIAGSAASAATATGKLKDNTEKAAKAAKGALAAFDQINVLQQDTADQSSGSGGGGGAMGFKPVDVTPQAQGIADKIKEIWDSIKKAAVDAWTWIVDIWTPIGTWLQTNVIDPIWSKVLWLWGIIKDSATELWGGGLQGIFNTFWAFISTFFVGNLKAAFELVKNIFKDVLVTVSGVITASIQILGGIIEFITGIFTGNWKKAWQGVQDIFKGIFNGIAAIVGGVINTIIDLINGMIGGVVAGVNAVISALNTVHINIPAMLGKPAYTFGINLAQVTAPQIPKIAIPQLATGAVIPPNAQFAAILGDQRSGTNIEAPESLIRQLLQEELGNNQMTLNNTITLDGEVVYKNQQKIQRRHGTSLISSGSSA